MLSLYGWADLIDHRHPLCHEEDLVLGWRAKASVKLFENNIKTTFFCPGHTVNTFTEISKRFLMPGMKSLS